MTSYTTKAMRGYIIVFIAGLGAGLAGYLFRVLIARGIGAYEFGLFTAVYTAFWLFNYVRDWGLGSAMAKYIPEWQVHGRWATIRSGIRFTLGVQALAGIFWAAVFVVGAEWLATHYFSDPSAATLVRIFAAVYVLRGLKEYARNLLQGFQRMLAHSIIYLVENAGIVVIVAILLASGITTAAAPMLAYLLIMLPVSVLALAWALRGQRILTGTLAREKGLSKQIFSYGLALMLGGFASMIYLYTDTLILTYFRPLDEVGVYNVAVTAAMLLTLVSKPIVTVLFPMISEIWARGKAKLLARGISLTHTYTLAIVTPPALVMIAFPEVLLRLVFGEEYVGGALVLQLLLAATLLLIIATLNLNLLGAVGHARASRNLGLSAAALNLAGNLILIPHYGMLAAAWTTLASYALLCFAGSIWMSRLTKIAMPWRRLGALALAGLAMLAVTQGIRMLPLTGTWVRIIVALVPAGIVYVALIFALRAVTREDVTFLKKNVFGALKRR